MKPAAAVVAGLVVVIALAGLAWVGRTAGTTLSDEENPRPPVTENKTDENDEERPEISETGPWPKAVMDETEHEFGVMEVNSVEKHKFIVRNEGDAPLKVVLGPTTCKCTLSEMEDDEISPGESTEIELQWEPKARAERFRQTAVLYTNDPKNAEIKLTVVGQVDKLLALDPPDSWNVGEIRDDEPTVVTGSITSKILEKFEVQEIESSHDNLTATAEPMTEEELKEREATAGYKLTATLEPGVPVGPFNERVTVKTDIRTGTDLVFHFRGHRAGPLRFVAMPGVKWYPESLGLDLGRFKAAEGKKATLLVLIDKFEGEEWKFEEIDSDPKFLKADLKKDPEWDGKGRQRYRLTFEVPPGSPPVIRQGKSGAKMTVRTNHPDAKELVFKLVFFSH